MTKKFIGIAIVVLLMFTLFGLYACSDATIADYKETAKAEITAHIIGLKQSDYSAENWMRIEQLANEGRTAISDATSKGQVDRAKTAAITAINRVPSREEIAMQMQAKQTYLDTILKAKNSNATIDDVSFSPFLGIYNDSLVAVFYGGQYHGVFIEVERSVKIEGLTFAWSDGYPILVWNDGQIYEFEQAFTQNLLTATNLVAIHELYYSEG